MTFVPVLALTIMDCGRTSDRRSRRWVIGVFEKIVVGWKGGRSSRKALEWAVERSSGIPLVVVHVIPGRQLSSEYLRDVGPLAEARIRLMETTDQVRAAHPELRLTTATVHGDPARELDDYVTGGTLVVVGVRSQRRPGRWTLGGRLAGSPGAGAVAIIPDDYESGERAGVVVAVDGSAASFEAIGVGIDEAERTGQVLTLVHAWRAPASWEGAYDEYADDIALTEEMHQQILDDALEFAASRGASPRALLEQGMAAEVIRDAARDASLLVVGSHGRGMVGRFLLGSVSQDVLLTVTSPTIVVRPAA